MTDQAPPIIVCGVARSGTTFAQDLLDAHPDIGVSDEFFVYRIKSVLTLFGELETALANRDSAATWSRRKGDLMRMLWFHASRQSRLVKGMDARRFANKTPGAEHYLEFYDSAFSATPPLYVYMLREGRKVFISRKNMKWGKTPTIRQQVKRYLASLEIMEKFFRAQPNRMFVLQLDRIEPTPDARRQAVDCLFNFIGEDVAPEVAEFVAAWRPAQTAAEHRRGTDGNLLRELAPDEQEYLDQHEPYQDAMRRWRY